MNSQTSTSYLHMFTIYQCTGIAIMGISAEIACLQTALASVSRPL